MTSSGTVWLWAHAGALALVLARVCGLAWTAPALATPGLGWRFRLVLAALLGAILIAGGRAGDRWRRPGGRRWGGRAWSRGLIGAGLGWSAALIVAGARQAGEIVGAQAGLSAAALFDPEAGDDLTPLGHLYGLIALAVFLALDGPLVAGPRPRRELPRAPGRRARSCRPRWRAWRSAGSARRWSWRSGPRRRRPWRWRWRAWPSACSAGRRRRSSSWPWRCRSARALGLVLVVLGLVTLAATFSAAWGDWPWEVGDALMTE